MSQVATVTVVTSQGVMDEKMETEENMMPIIERSNPVFPSGLRLHCVTKLVAKAVHEHSEKDREREGR